MGSFADRLKEYHRSLRPKRGDELSMKQVACFFGGLYAVIHLLQYFDLWTLLILMVVGYVLFRQAQNTIQALWSGTLTGGEETSTQQDVPQSKVKTKGTKKSQRDAQAKS